MYDYPFPKTSDPFPLVWGDLEPKELVKMIYYLGYTQDIDPDYIRATLGDLFNTLEYEAPDDWGSFATDGKLSDADLPGWRPHGGEHCLIMDIRDVTEHGRRVFT
jgi:hypothetical protein